jgi:thymidylate synthase
LVLKDRGQSLLDYDSDDFAFENYDPHPHISAPVAV